MYDGLRNLSRTLSSAQAAEVPPTLKASIMRRVAEPRRPAAATHAPFSLRHALASLLSSLNPGWAFAGGAVAGIALVVAILFSISSPISSETDVAGTMVRTPDAGSFVPVAHAEFDGRDVRGSAISLRSGAFRLVTFHVESEGAVVSRIDFPKDHLQLSAIRSTEGSGTEIQNIESGVSVRSAGSASIELLFLTSDERIDSVPVTISRDGHEVCRADIGLEASGN
jgi:hypothetical protein